MRRAQEDIFAAADALQAFRAGEDTEDALVGAMLVAEFFGLIRGFLKSE